MDSRTRTRWLVAATFFALLCAIPTFVVLLTMRDPAQTVGEPPPTPSVDAEEPTDASEAVAEPPPPTRVVAGRVRAADGTPVFGALVHVTDFPETMTESDESGRYRLVGVPHHARSIEVDAEGFLPAKLLLGRPRSDDERADVVLEREELTGRVLDPDGAPLPGARIRCDEHETTTDSVGRFRLPLQAAGCPAKAYDARLGETAELAIEADRDNVLRFSGPGLLAGMVVDERGAPLPSFVVGVERGPSQEGQRHAVDDAGGRFELTGLAAGRYTLVASAVGRPSVTAGPIDLGPGEKHYGLRITLALGVPLRGRVLDGASRAGIEGATIEIEMLGSLASQQRLAARSDAAGDFTIDGAPSHTVSLRAGAGGYRSTVVAGVRAGQGTLEILLNALAVGEERATEFTGIAAGLRGTPEGVVVAAVFDGGPAEAAGVRAGDVITRIDGVIAEGFTVAQCVERLRGPVGSRVLLGVRRKAGGDSQELEMWIRRDRFVR